MVGHDALVAFAAFCGPLMRHGPLTAASVAGMFALGIGGSAAHCGPMCGPLVVGQVAERLEAVPAHAMCKSRRLRAGLLLPYHAGRLTTYAAMGALSGAAGLAFVRTLAPLRTALLLVAAGVLLAAAFGRLNTNAALGGWLRRRARVLRRDGAGGTYLLGLVLGLLPCGLLYAALIGACALATPALGAAGMLAFGLGTVPVLAAIGVAGQFRPVRAGLARAAPWVLAANAVVLAIAAIGGMLI